MPANGSFSTAHGTSSTPPGNSSLFIPNGSGLGNDPYSLFNITNYTLVASGIQIQTEAVNSGFVPAGYGLLFKHMTQVGDKIQANETLTSITFEDVNSNPLSITYYQLI